MASLMCGNPCVGNANGFQLVPQATLKAAKKVCSKNTQQNPGGTYYD